MRIGDRHAAVLAVAEQRDVVHRPRPVERDQRDDVAEAGRPDLRPASAACLPIPAGTRRPCRRAGAVRRPPDRPTAARRNRPRCRAAASSRWPSFSTDRVLRPRKSNFTSPARLDIFHVELGDRHVRARVAVERHQLVAAAGRRSPRRRHGSRCGAAGLPASSPGRTAASRRGRPRYSFSSSATPFEAALAASRDRSDGWAPAWPAGRPGHSSSAAPGRCP